MATYVIGDIQGCWDQLANLLQEIEFDSKRDELWLTGDLVNRGPDSLRVLRWAADQGDRLRVVLGNHDLKLLARSHGIQSAGRDSDLEPVLEADDRDRLLDWLVRRPLLCRDDLNRVLVHAGLDPAWTLDQAEELATRAARALREDPRAVLTDYYARDFKLPRDHPAFAMGVLTLIRTVDDRGRMDLAYSGTLRDAPAGLRPWFQAGRREEGRVFFGHWAALGYFESPQAVCVDSGCVWGGSLTAYRLDDGVVFRVPGWAEGAKPHKSSKNA